LLVRDFLPTRSAWIEITAVSDADFAGDKRMKPIVQRFVELANKMESGCGKFLQFEFGEKMGFEAGTFIRKLLAPARFSLEPELLEQFATWLPRSLESAPLVLRRPDLDLTITRRPYALKHLDYRGRTVPAFYDIEKNPIFARLEKKRRLKQLPIGKTDNLCGIILWDAGCWGINDSFRSPNTVRIDAILDRCIQRSGVDFVSVFTPRRQPTLSSLSSEIKWISKTYGATDNGFLDQIAEVLKRVVIKLPRPRFEAGDARSLQNRGSYEPSATGWYLAPTETWKDNKLTIKVSARALHEALAAGDFRGLASRYATGADGKRNVFANQLAKGHTFKTCRIEPAGPDEDDDHVVFEFSEDAAASPFKVKSQN
jgi:hypothetical protein